MTFREWFASHEWHKENSRREDFAVAWDIMALSGMTPDKIASVLDRTIEAMRDEAT